MRIVASSSRWVRGYYADGKREFVVCSEVKDWLSQAIKLSIEHDANETAEMGDRKRRELAHCFNELIRACYEQAFPYDVVFCQYVFRNMVT